MSGTVHDLDWDDDDFDEDFMDDDFIEDFDDDDEDFQD